MGIVTDPLKARCKKCGEKIKYYKSMFDSDFFACECKTDGLYNTVIYYGWDLPDHWKLPIFYWIRWKLANIIMS